MHLASITTYPIKACHRVEQQRALVEPWGLAGDRRWMVIDRESGRRVSQRETPILTQVQPELPRLGTSDCALVVRTPGMADLAVAQPVDGDLIEVSIRTFTGLARSAGAAADEWFSTVLGMKVRLVWLDDPARRAVHPSIGAPGDTVVFADNSPVTLVNLSSLHALNDLIGESGSESGSGSGSESREGPLPVTRFRPNLVLEGAPAWAEDGWVGGRLRVGDAVFRVPKGCARCRVTTTDQETGERGAEPLRTLGLHRSIDQKLYFATHLIPERVGSIAVGDVVDLVS
jgi:MOSC domain-containing protein